MAVASGFIQLHRKIVEWEWYQNPNTFRLFLHCLLMANYTDGRFEGQDVKRGQFVTSLEKLSVQTRLTVRQVRVSLDHLIMTGELTSISYPKFRIITVVKYDVYQSDDRQNDKQMTSERQANDKQMTSERQQYNNNNNNNKGIMEKGNNNISFDRFWTAYPRKEGKPKAKAAFDKLKPDEGLLQRMLDSIERWKHTDQWQEDGGRYIPHPSTWLNQRRWEDEPMPAKKAEVVKQRVLPAQDFGQRDYSEVQKELEEQQRNRIVEMLCRNNDLWDETNSKPVDGWREKLDQLKAEGKAV